MAQKERPEQISEAPNTTVTMTGELNCQVLFQAPLNITRQTGNPRKMR